MRVLSIETSCDETAIAIVDIDTTGHHTTRANEVLSQAALHSQYGGVFPAVAKREHARAGVPLLVHALKTAGLFEPGDSLPPEKERIIRGIFTREPEMFEMFAREMGDSRCPEIDRIAVTEGPGLEPALWVGINLARALGVLWGIPVIPVNHMEGHILAALFDPETGTFPTLTFPMVALLISGGHTELVRMDAVGSYTLLGETQDDAVGECFDKVARMLALPYPGGPEISRIAREGSPGVHPLPRPMLHSGDLHFSFSGLKTSVLYLIKKIGELDPRTTSNIAREFEEAVTEVLVSKSEKALTETGAHGLIVGGGVSANTRIRNGLGALCDRIGIPLFLPSKDLSTDNALMIALSGAQKKDIPRDLVAKGHWKIHS